MDKKDAGKEDVQKKVMGEFFKPGEEKPLQQPEKKKPEPSKQEAPKENDDKKKIEDLTDKLLRLQAEFDNYQKRTAKEKEHIARHAEGRMMLRMLPLYEELALAEKEAQKLTDENLKKGMLMVLGKLRASFEKEGLQPMKLVGEKFDPFRHETAMREDSEKPEGTILQVIAQGYLFKGEVLRHAMVSVSSGKKPDGKNEVKS